METGKEPLKLEELSAEQLGYFVNGLIEQDFSRLVQLLYRLDVSEAKLKSVLLEHPTGDAGNMIAKLILERLAQSKRSKELFRMNEEIPEDEKW